MDQAVLVNQQFPDEMYNEGQSFLSSIDKQGVRVIDALWRKSKDQSQWSFYITVRDFNKLGPLYFFTRIQKIFKKEVFKHIRTSNIQIAPEENPYIRMISSIITTNGSVSRIEFFTNYLNGMEMDDLVIYKIGKKKPNKR